MSKVEDVMTVYIVGYNPCNIEAVLLTKKEAIAYCSRKNKTSKYKREYRSVKVIYEDEHDG